MAVLSFIHILWFSSSVYALSSCGNDTCPAKIIRPNTVEYTPNVFLAVLLPLHLSGPSFTCGGIDPVQLLRLHAVDSALKSLTSRLEVKSNVTIGVIAIDSCDNLYKIVTEVTGIERCLSVASHNNTTISRGDILAYLDFHSFLSVEDDLRYENSLAPFSKPFFRLTNWKSIHRFLYSISSTEHQIRGLMNVILSTSNKLHYTMVVYSATEKHTSMYRTFLNLSINTTVCAAYSANVHRTTDLVSIALKIEQNRSYRFLVLFLTADHLTKLLKLLEVNTEVDSVLYSVIVLVPDSSGQHMRILHRSRMASISLQYSISPNVSQSIINFEQDYKNLKPWTSPFPQYFAEIWQDLYNCSSLVTCGNETTFFTKDIMLNVNDVFYSVDILAAGIDKAVIEFCKAMPCNWSKSDDVFSNLTEMIRTAMPYGSPVFTGDANYPTIQYSVMMLKPMKAPTNRRQFVPIGLIDSNGRLKLTEQSKVEAFDRKGQGKDPSSRCPPNKQYDCKLICPSVKMTTQSTIIKTTATNTDLDFPNTDISEYFPVGYELSGAVINQRRSTDTIGFRYSVVDNSHAWVIAILVCAVLGIIIVIIVEIFIVRKVLTSRNEPTVQIKYSTFALGQLLLFSVLLSYITLFAFIFVPDAASCGVMRFGVGFCYAIMYTSVMVKLLVLLMSKPNQYGNQGVHINSGLQAVIFLTAVAIQIAISVQWLIQVMPGAVFVQSYGNENVWICNHYTWAVGEDYWQMSTFIRSTDLNHILSLIYISFLILVALILSVVSLGIVTNLRESRSLCFCICMTIPVWIAWQLLAGLIHNFQHHVAHEIADASTAFGLFFIATIMLLTMFIPRDRQKINAGLQILYIEDDKDSKVFDSVSFVTPKDLHLLDLTHGSSFYRPNGSVIDGEPAVLETSYSVPYDKLSSYNSGYATFDVRREKRMDDTSNMDKQYASSTLGRTREHISKYINDPHALHAVHPRTPGSSYNSSYTIYNSTPNLSPPQDDQSSVLNQSIASGNRNRKFLLSHDLTGRRHVHATMFPAASSDIGEQKSKKLKPDKRSKSYEGLVGAL